MRRAKRGETGLGLVFRVRVAGVETRALLKVLNPGVGERDQQTGVWVDVNVLRVVAAIAHIVRLRVVCVRGEWAYSVLARQPGGLVGEVINARQIGAEFARSLHRGRSQKTSA
jgi:hypothetical protein